MIPRSILKKCGDQTKRRRSFQNIFDENNELPFDENSLEDEAIYG